MNRQQMLENLAEQPKIDVLIIGAGINGVGAFRDLTLQGLRVAIVDKGDFCSGGSAGSSHMLHGGIRYLENGEFRLVREALHERNLLLKNAPHYAKPLPTTIPIFKWFSGIFNAPLRFLQLQEKPSERGAIIIKLGLMMYDFFTGAQQTMPYHKVQMKSKSLARYPKLNADIVCTATYYDAYMPSPERLCLDILQDSLEESNDAIALNYMNAIEGKASSVILRDEITGNVIEVFPKTVINAGGAWIDFVNKRLGKKSQFIGGTKGSHIIVENQELLEATGNSEIFFENSDGRIVLILPYMGKVMIGTTDIKIENPDEIDCTGEEIDYMLTLVNRVFPSIKIEKSQIVYAFSGVRPLPTSTHARTGAISRDHSINTIAKDNLVSYNIHSLVGGKWTTFRAFSEQITDLVLKELNVTRKISTTNLAIGGGKGYPANAKDLETWIHRVSKSTNINKVQLAMLFERYGTKAEVIAEFIQAGSDKPLDSLPQYSRREIIYILQNEFVQRPEDLLTRRTLISMLGNTKEQVVEEIISIMAEEFGWSRDVITIHQNQALSLIYQVP